jgi:hypothetical protein
MAGIEHAVALVADLSFGERVAPLSRRLHVWLRDSDENKAAAEMVWREFPEPSIERGVTTFKADPSASPEEAAAAILGTLELHHGEYSHDPPIRVLEIFGARPVSPLVEALDEIGFRVCENTPDGFIARAGK